MPQRQQAGTNTPSRALTRKLHQRDAARSDWYEKFMAAPPDVRAVWNLAAAAIGQAIGEAPFSERSVIVFSSQKAGLEVEAAAVSRATALLRHGASGFDVRMSRSRGEGPTDLRIVYRHKSLL